MPPHRQHLADYVNPLPVPMRFLKSATSSPARAFRTSQSISPMQFTQAYYGFTARMRACKHQVIRGLSRRGARPQVPQFLTIRSNEPGQRAREHPFALRNGLFRLLPGIEYASLISLSRCSHLFSVSSTNVHACCNVCAIQRGRLQPHTTYSVILLDPGPISPLQ